VEPLRRRERRDAALKWAAKCPGIKGGSIEVRPLGIITAPDGSIAAMQQ